jgi:hypothetical protein
MLFSAVPRDRRQVYRMRPIIEAVMDKGSVFEVGRVFGRSIITALARLDGLPVAVLASDPYQYGGAWTAEACQKLVRFVDMAETFHLPVVYLADCPGFLIGWRLSAAPPSAWCARHGGDQSVEHAVVYDHYPQCLWRRRSRARAGRAAGFALCLVVGLVGFAAARGRH